MAKKRIEIDTVYEYFQYVNEILGEKRQRRLTILKYLQDKGKQTFKELEKGTKISTGSLHGHLEKLYGCGLVQKTGEYPANYKTTKAFYYFIKAAETAIDMRKRF